MCDPSTRRTSVPRFVGHILLLLGRGILCEENSKIPSSPTISTYKGMGTRHHSLPYINTRKFFKLQILIITNVEFKDQKINLLYGNFTIYIRLDIRLK